MCIKKPLLYLATLLVLIAPLSVSHAFTKADIDLLVSLDVIENTSFIPLLYLLAEDTPTPSTAEIIAAVEASKNTDIKNETEEDDSNEPSKAVRVEVLQNLKMSAYVEKPTIAGNNETGVYTISFDVTASGNDLWIKDEVSESNGGFVYKINSENTFTGSQIAFISDTSASEKKNDSYKISEGSTESFELTIELHPDEVATNEVYEIQLQSITFANNSMGTGEYTFNFSNKSKYRTKKLFLK